MYDIVYAVRDSSPNEELRYSLRSVERNWGPHGKIWFFGGKPTGLEPDEYIHVTMPLSDKWKNIHRTMRRICMEDAVTEDFWYFNDDFFVVRATREDMPQQVNGELWDAIVEVERTFGCETSWTRQLRVLVDVLGRGGMGQRNFEVHKPMLINRRRMLAMMDEFPCVWFFRSMYGNYYDIPAENAGDVLVMDNSDISRMLEMRPVFLSSTEESFASGGIGRYIRAEFPDACRQEVDE